MIVFSHIPKTAGTTLNGILRKSLGYKLISVIPRSGSTYLKSDFEKDFARGRLPSGISGHPLKAFIDFGHWESEFEWITFLRDPVHRFVSQYVHQQTSNVAEYNLDIISWGKKYQRSNWQVKWIAGVEDLEAAKQILSDKFKFVGLVEKFDESLSLLSQNVTTTMDTSYKKLAMVARNNGLKEKLLQDQEVKQFILQQNELDIGLYDHVTSTWNAQRENKSGQKAQAPMSSIREAAGKYGFYARNFIYRKLRKR